jgi:hypothetical protein
MQHLIDYIILSPDPLINVLAGHTACETNNECIVQSQRGFHRVYRVQGFLSSRPKLGPPAPSSAYECSSPLPLGPGGRHNRLREREWWEPNSDEGTDTQVLCVYYNLLYIYCFPAGNLYYQGFQEFYPLICSPSFRKILGSESLWEKCYCSSSTVQ